MAPVAEHPAGGPLHQPDEVQHHLQLHAGRYLVIQGLDHRPGIAQPEQFQHGDIGPGDVRCRGPGGLALAQDEIQSHAVDDIVGHLGRHDLPVQAVFQDLLLVLRHQPLWESGLYHLPQVRVPAEVGLDQLLLEDPLGVGDHDRKLGPGQGFALDAAFRQLLVRGNELQRPVQPSRILHEADEAAIFPAALYRLELRQADGLGLVVVVLQHQLRNAVGHLLEQRVAVFFRQVAACDDRVEQDLDVDLVVGAVHAPGVVDEVGVAAPAPEGEFHPRQLGDPQVPPLPYHAAAQLVGIHPQGIVGLVPHIGMGLHAGFDVGADTAVPEQVNPGAQQVGDQLVGREMPLLDIEALLHLRRYDDRLGGATEHAAAGGDQFAVVVRPARTGKVEQALPLGKTGGGIRLRVDEDMQVVESRHQADMRGEQHAVTEDIAGHVADTHHGEIRLLDVDTHLAEMPLHRHPGAAGGDAHLLVVVAGAAAGGEGITQPEIIVGGDTVGDIGERGSALVRCHHQVGILLVLRHNVLRAHDTDFGAVVGNVQQAPDEQLVALDALLLHLVPGHLRPQLLRHEATLGADRHDHRVLYLLGFHQAQHLGAEILQPVGPAQPAPRHLAAAQVNAFHPG